ncbi:type III pantothenate kinase [Anaerobranca gottschalkii]|uniref:Type III pantothenate kinase n=1 Tax=Anaerobranca gottschalkii DSM 13577 TaxID=1120990 RepID=A0A1I0AYR8_9FIRM|nr:type III pantothenate kinase [Anaerobranca gottschalkii]SES98943.1 type III pantothenate kinase [Anaerobranca gottschalkii DSM 13577]
MLLALDVGNTNIVIGLFQGEKLIHNWRISTTRSRTEDEYGIILKNLFIHNGLENIVINGIIISSVVPPVMPALQKMAKKYFNIEPIVVGPGIKTSMPIKTENPREVGADRIVNAVATIHKYGTPAIVVDYGTATTFCVINRKGEYLGGCIAPGIGISTEALFERAAKLPRIELTKPESIIGKNTITSMQSGIIYGYMGQLEGLIQRISQETNEKYIVVVTGGLGKLVADQSPLVDYIDPYLTLEGLRILYEKNKK